MSQPRLNVSVNVRLDDILCIAEPFVAKPSMVRHHYKPECHMQKMGFCLQGQGYSNLILVRTMKYDYYMLHVLNCWFLGATNLVWQCMFISWMSSEKVFAVFKVKVTVKVLNFSECLPGQYLWSVKLSMVINASSSARVIIWNDVTVTNPQHICEKQPHHVIDERFFYR